VTSRLFKLYLLGLTGVKQEGAGVRVVASLPRVLT